MACTFDPELPTDRDWVRLLIGDTGPAAVPPEPCVLSDEEINAMVTEIITEHGSGVWTKYCAAALAGTALAASALSAVGAGDVLRKTVGRLSLTRQSGVDVRAAYDAHIKTLSCKCAALMSPRPRIFASVGKTRTTRGRTVIG